MFSPTLHSQRHQFVIDFVKKNKPQKVVDLGCGECSLLKKLKCHREVELLVGVDIDGAKVKRKMHGLAPIPTDYLQPSSDQLCIELYEGSVTQEDARLRGFDLVTSIELIEHLTLPDVERFSDVVFGYMTPVEVIVSTPNSEFNPLFPGLKGFRHSDHKFEWTRAEFQSWALKVCLKYGYKVEFTGVGEAPTTGMRERVGFCSQIGVFHCLWGRFGCNTSGDDSENVYPYTLLVSINYPSLRDNNIKQRFLVSEVLFWVEKLKRRWMEERTGERGDTFTPCRAEGGAEERLGASEKRREMDDPVERCWRGVSENGDGEDLDLICANSPEQQESCSRPRCVSVPLAVLWSCSPKIGALSGSLGNLRHVLMQDPEVKLSQDGSAVLVQEEELEEEEGVDLEDSGYHAEPSQRSRVADQEESWEANV